MASSDDLKSHAASSHDFYALLDLSPTAAENEIRRAYRRTALKYHPDKISNPTPADIDKFHLLQIAYDVLSDPSVRQLYDNAREARERKKRETEMLEGVRRKMKEDLEARERGVKRPWAPSGPTEVSVGENAEAKLEQEIKRLAEDGKRRRREKEELLRRDVLEEEERQEREREEKERNVEKEDESNRLKNTGGTSVPEIDRTVKIRWAREGAGFDIDKERLKDLFSTFGDIESVFTLKDKRQRVGDKREKKTLATGVVVFRSIVSAHAAVEDIKKLQGGEWDIIESVFWASNKEPDYIFSRPPGPTVNQNEMTEPPTSSSAASSEPTSETKPKYSFPGLNSASSIPGSNGQNTKTPPSFSSFSSTSTKTSKGSSEAKGNFGPNSPSLEEITLIRLKNAERQRLEEQIRKEDEAAAAENPDTR